MKWPGKRFSNAPRRWGRAYFVSALVASTALLSVTSRARLSPSHLPRHAAVAQSTQAQSSSNPKQPSSPDLQGPSISSGASLRRDMKSLRHRRGILAFKTRSEGVHAPVPRRGRMMHSWFKDASQPVGRAPPQAGPLVSAISLSFQNEVPDGPSDGREKVWWIHSDLQIGTDTPSFGTVPVDGRIAEATRVGAYWVGAADRTRVAPMIARFASLQFVHVVASLSRTGPASTRIPPGRFAGCKPAAIRVCQTESFAQGSAIR